jgi:hypothetical protein
MSVSHPDSLHFSLDTGEALKGSYDEQADILYLWLGKKPREAISVTSNEGHLVRLDPESYEVVGFTIFDFCRRWQDDDPGGQFPVTLPSLGESGGEITEAQTFALLAS